MSKISIKYLLYKILKLFIISFHMNILTHINMHMKALQDDKVSIFMRKYYWRLFSGNYQP